MTLPSSSSSPYIWFTRGRVSLPDILVCLGANGSKYIGNWKIRENDFTHETYDFFSETFKNMP